MDGLNLIGSHGNPGKAGFANFALVVMSRSSSTNNVTVMNVNNIIMLKLWFGTGKWRRTRRGGAQCPLPRDRKMTGWWRMKSNVPSIIENGVQYEYQSA